MVTKGYKNSVLYENTVFHRPVSVTYISRHTETTTQRRIDMKNVTLTQIRKEVVAAGGEYKKLKMYLNGQDAYEVNSVTMTKANMIERFNEGAL